MFSSNKSNNQITSRNLSYTLQNLIRKSAWFFKLRHYQNESESMLLYVYQMYFQINSISITWTRAGTDGDEDADGYASTEEDAVGYPYTDEYDDGVSYADAGWHSGEISKHLDYLPLMSANAMNFVDKLQCVTSNYNQQM